MQPIVIDSFIIFADNITQTAMDVELLFEGKILHVYVGCHFHHAWFIFIVFDELNNNYMYMYNVF